MKKFWDEDPLDQFVFLSVVKEFTSQVIFAICTTYSLMARPPLIKTSVTVIFYSQNHMQYTVIKY